jgi:hypothetical protein
MVERDLLLLDLLPAPVAADDPDSRCGLAVLSPPLLPSFSTSFADEAGPPLTEDDASGFGAADDPPGPPAFFRIPTEESSEPAVVIVAESDTARPGLP